MYSDSTLSVKDATGRHISLLNDNQHSQEQHEQPTPTPTYNGKRKYHCTEPGCNKSFTTSGHLARHHRIHTGEKNFHCLHPSCPSRFSRQDNMMQHYRTHLSPKSRRHQQQQQPQQQRNKATSTKDHHPRLHRHTMVGSEDHSAIHPLIDTKPSSDMMDYQYRPSANTTVTRSRRATTMPSSFHPCSPTSSSMNAFYKRKQLHQLSSVMTSSMMHPPHHHHHLHHQPTTPHLNSLIQPLGKPLPIEPDSTPSPTSIITSPTCMDSNSTMATTPSPDTYRPPPHYHHHQHHHLYQPYQISRRPQRAHSASSTCSSSTSSSSFLSPRQSSLSPPPLVDQADIIYPKQFIQLPPPPLQQQQQQQQQQEKNQLHHITSQGHHHLHRQDLLDLAHTVSIFG